jgi:hypothetical protein
LCYKEAQGLRILYLRQLIATHTYFVTNCYKRYLKDVSAMTIEDIDGNTLSITRKKVIVVDVIGGIFARQILPSQEKFAGLLFRPIFNNQ